MKKAGFKVCERPNGVIYLDDDSEIRFKHVEGPHYPRNKGYGSKIPTDRMCLVGDDKRWRRVYMMQWANAGTAYFMHWGDMVVIPDYRF